MKFLVYSATPTEENATLDSYKDSMDKELSRIMYTLERMDLDRLLDHESVGLLVDNIRLNASKDYITADIYKQANPDSALHGFKKEGGTVTVQEILSEQDDAFKKGLLGVKKVEGEINIIIQKKFGSYFSAACRGLDLDPHFSSETINSIQNSASIGKTTLDFSDNYDVFSSLIMPPEDEDIRKESGLAGANMLNDLMEIMNISRTHRITIDITRDEWLDNIDTFEQLIESGIVSTIRIEGTKDNIVKLGEGGDRAIRETVETDHTDSLGVRDAFEKIEE